jgi:hypothetical protein
MTKLELNRRASSRRNKNVVPLSKLRASEVVRTVVDHPRRLDELVHLLRDKERSIRDRAAATLARLSESHPARLVRHLEALREGLADDSAYVRWHLLYTLGQVVPHHPKRAAVSLEDIKARLADEDRVVRNFARKAMESVAGLKPGLVQGLYAGGKEEMPAFVARILERSGMKAAGK